MNPFSDGAPLTLDLRLGLSELMERKKIVLTVEAPVLSTMASATAMPQELYDALIKESDRR